MKAQIIKIKPPEAKGLNEKTEELAALELDKAIEELRATIRLQPDNAKAHYDLAHALINKDDIDGAIETCEHAFASNRIRLDS